MDETEQGARLVITIAPDMAKVMRRMAATMNVALVEVARRGVVFLKLAMDLSENEELVIRDKTTGDFERIRFVWDI